MSSGNEIPLTRTTQQERAEEILKAMASTNGGELIRDEAGRLRLRHPPTTPQS